MKPSDIEKSAQLIWNYHHLRHRLEPADVICVLCSHDPRVAEHGAKLFRQGWAPWILFSGREGKLTEGLYEKPEAEHFADVAESLGVPRFRMLIEDQATNTGENVVFSLRLLAAHNLPADRLILVQKPFMERRTYATFRKHCPDRWCAVTSPRIAWRDYPTRQLTRKHLINVMVGDLQRIRLYAERGFQIPQPIPPKVWKAYEALVAAGYDRHLMT